MIPIPLVVVGVVAGAALARKFLSTPPMRKHAEARGGSFQERSDELATTFTLPPFVDLPEPAAVLPAYRPVRVFDVAQFATSGSQTMAMRVEVSDGSAEPPTYQVVALHTRQHLPRTMVRAGIDVYVLPGYEGMHRIRTPKRWVRGGILSIISAEPDRAADLPYDAISRGLAEDRMATFVADGDWLYVFRPGAPATWRIAPMLVTLEQFARAIENPPWPTGEGPPSYVYGQV